MPDVPLAVIGDERRRWLRAAFELADLIEGEVRFDRHDRMLYATDASIYQVEPLGVVIPASIDEAVKVMRYCHQHDLPLLPRGGGTALAGQSVNRAVVLDFSRHCTAVRDLDPAAATATVEPGVVLDQLNRAAAPHGLMFGPDVATSTHATLGGMIGNNSAGAHSILYGRTVEHLAALDVALADGTRLTLDEGAAERDEQVAALARGVADIVRPLAAEIRARLPDHYPPRRRVQPRPGAGSARGMHGGPARPAEPGPSRVRLGGNARHRARCDGEPGAGAGAPPAGPRRLPVAR